MPSFQEILHRRDEIILNLHAMNAARDILARMMLKDQKYKMYRRRLKAWIKDGTVEKIMRDLARNAVEQAATDESKPLIVPAQTNLIMPGR